VNNLFTVVVVETKITFQQYPIVNRIVNENHAISSINFFDPSEICFEASKDYDGDQEMPSDLKSF
jgi:hypothetical protein